MDVLPNKHHNRQLISCQIYINAVVNSCNKAQMQSIDQGGICDICCCPSTSIQNSFLQNLYQVQLNIAFAKYVSNPTQHIYQLKININSNPI